MYFRNDELDRLSWHYPLKRRQGLFGGTYFMHHISAAAEVISQDGSGKNIGLYEQQRPLRRRDRTLRLIHRQ
jgi:hypothetical protein